MTHTTTDRRASIAAATTGRASAFRDPRSLCALVFAANAGLVVCCAGEPFTAALALHLVLLPCSAWRLLLAMKAARWTQASIVEMKRFDTTARQRAESLRRPAFDPAPMAQTVRLSPRNCSPKA